MARYHELDFLRWMGHHRHCAALHLVRAIKACTAPPRAHNARMRTILALACLLLSGCAHTTVRNGSGVRVFFTQANASHLAFRAADGTLLDVIDLNHSTVTTAGGTAATKIIGAGVTGITAVVGAHGL